MFQGPLLSRYSCGDRSMLMELGGCDSKAANLTGLTFCQSTKRISGDYRGGPDTYTSLAREPPSDVILIESADD